MTLTRFPAGLVTGSSPNNGLVLQCLRVSGDPTSSAAVSVGTLPTGATPVGVQSLGGATGGTNPTVNVGLGADPDGLAAGLDADGLTTLVATGAEVGTALTADTAVTLQVGSSAATGGTTAVLVYFIRES